MYNLFPWLLKWISSRKEFHRLSASSQQKNLEILTQLKETLNPQRCRGLIDTFMVHMQSLEVRTRQTCPRVCCGLSHPSVSHRNLGSAAATSTKTTFSSPS